MLAVLKTILKGLRLVGKLILSLFMAVGFGFMAAYSITNGYIKLGWLFIFFQIIIYLWVLGRFDSR